MLLQRQDQRKARRRPMRRAAVVSFAPVGKPLSCVVWDMSEGGARLAIACPTADVPREFQLVLTRDGSVRRNCAVVWTNARFVGVKFL
jgi:PilZ domain